MFVGEPDFPAAVDPSGRDRASPSSRPGESLTGLPGCPGVAEGRARVILDSHDPTALEPGDVLVAPITDPSWTPLFVPAARSSSTSARPLSHAIIVSRELGIPCVVSATGGHEGDPRRRDGPGRRLDRNRDGALMAERCGG